MSEVKVTVSRKTILHITIEDRHGLLGEAIDGVRFIAESNGDFTIYSGVKGEAARVVEFLKELRIALLDYGGHST